jgi:hypothetical protein
LAPAPRAQRTQRVFQIEPMRYLLLCAAVLWAPGRAPKIYSRSRPKSPLASLSRRVYTGVDTDFGFVHDECDRKVIDETLRFRSDTSEAAPLREVDAHKSYYQTILRSWSPASAAA